MEIQVNYVPLTCISIGCQTQFALHLTVDFLNPFKAQKRGGSERLVSPYLPRLAPQPFGSVCVSHVPVGVLVNSKEFESGKKLCFYYGKPRFANP